MTGSVFITTLNKTFLANLLGVYLVENVLDLVPKGTHQFEKFIEPHKLQRLLEDCKYFDLGKFFAHNLSSTS